MRPAKGFYARVDGFVVVPQRDVFQRLPDAFDVEGVDRPDGRSYHPQANGLSFAGTGASLQPVSHELVGNKSLLCPTKGITPIFDPRRCRSELRYFLRDLQHLAEHVFACVAVEKNDLISRSQFSDVYARLRLLCRGPVSRNCSVAV